MGNWWQRFLIWLGISEPGTRKEQVEDWLEANATRITDLHAEQVALRGGRGTYRQLRRLDRFLTTIPVWADFSLDVYEAPVPAERALKTTTFGYTLSFYVTELDATKWILTIDPEILEDPKWVEVKSV